MCISRFRVEGLWRDKDEASSAPQTPNLGVPGALRYPGDVQHGNPS